VAATLDVIYRVTGSVAFIAQARAAWAVLLDPQDAKRRLLLKLKANLAPADITGLAFTIAAKEQDRPVLTWSSEPVTVTLSDLMGGFSNTRRGPKNNKLEAAKALISKTLGDGEEHPSTELDETAEAADITFATMMRARKALGVRAWKGGFDGGWMVCLPAGRGAEDASHAIHSGSSAKSFSQKDLTQVERAKNPNYLGDKDSEEDLE
jgi:putative DNA primase/helicase